MLKLLRRLFRGREADAAPDSEVDPRVVIKADSERCTATVDIDSFSPEAQPALYEAIAQQQGLPVFEGEVRHGYSKTTLRNPSVCPRCGAPTRQYSAHFIYATDKGMRVMMAPAGLFCSRCPTVVVDEDLIAAGVKSGFQYQGVVGIDFLGKKEPAAFETWNGRKPIYVFDEDEQCHGMGFAGLPIAHSNPQRSRSATRKKKQRRRMAKQSIRRNR